MTTPVDASTQSGMPKPHDQGLEHHELKVATNPPPSASITPVYDGSSLDNLRAQRQFCTEDEYLFLLHDLLLSVRTDMAINTRNLFDHRYFVNMSLIGAILTEIQFHTDSCRGYTTFCPPIPSLHREPIFEDIFADSFDFSIPVILSTCPPKAKRGPSYDVSMTDEEVYSEIATLFSESYTETTYTSDIRVFDRIEPLPYTPTAHVSDSGASTESAIPALDFLSFIEEKLPSITDGLGSATANVLLDLAILVKFWFSVTSFTDKFLLLANFVRHAGLHLKTDMYTTLIKELKKHIASIQALDPLFSYSAPDYKAKWTPTSKVNSAASIGSFASFLDSTASIVDGMATSPVFVSLNTIFACAIAHSLMGDQIPGKLIYSGLVNHTTISKWTERRDVPQMTSELMKAVSSVIKHFTTRNLGDHVFDINNKVNFIECVRWLMLKEYMRYTPGTEVVADGWVSDDTWLRNLDLANEVYLTLPHDYANASLAAHFYLQMTKLLLKARGSAYGSRPLPFNFGIYSAPGTGKSTWISEAITHCALEAMEVRNAPPRFEDVRKMICTVNQADKYFSTYSPERHYGVILDEMGAAVATAAGNDVMEALTCLLGEGDYALNKAAVEDKGKIFFQPYVISCVSNSPTYGIDDYLNYKNAFFRRFSFSVNVRVKCAFRKKGPDNQDCDGIDINALGVDRTEAVEFKLYSPTPSGFVGIEGGEEVGWITYRQLMDFVRVQAIDHARKTSAIKTTREYIGMIHSDRCVHLKYNCAECEIGEPLLDTRPVQIFEPTSSVELVLPWAQSLRFTTVDIFIFCALFCGRYLSCLITFWNFGRKINLYCKNHYDVLKKDVGVARTMIERADQVLNRYYAVKAEMYSTALNVAEILTGLALAYGVYRAAKAILPSRETTPNIPVHTHFPTATTEELHGGPPVEGVKGNVWDENQGFIQYGKSSSMPLKDIHDKIRRNMRRLSFTIDGKIHRTQVTGITKQFAVGPWHSLRLFTDKSCTVSFEHSIGGRTHTTNHDVGSACNAVRIGADLGIIRLAGTNAFADITKLLPRAAQYTGRASRCDGVSLYYDKLGLFQSRPFKGLYNTISYEDHRFDTKYRVSGFEGLFETPFEGNCGSPLVATIGAQSALLGVITASCFSQSTTIYHALDLALFNKGVQDLESRTLVYSPSSSLGYQDSPEASTLSRVNPLSSKNHVYWMEPREAGSIRVVGSNDAAFTRKAVSSVIDYPHRQELFGKFPVEYHHDLIAPRFDGYLRADGVYLSSERNALGDLAQQATNIDPVILDWAVEDYSTKCATAQDFEKDSIWDTHTCINGVPDSMASSMPKTTSAGFPDGGKKYDHLVPHHDVDGALSHFTLTPDMEAKVALFVERASEGCRNGIIYKTCPKDEPRERAKVADRKIRQFVLAPMSFFVLCKKFLGGFMGIYTRNFLITETTGGINPFSPEWTKVHAALSIFPRVINGDFSKFDKKSSTLMIMAAMSVVIRVKKAALVAQGLEMSREYENSLVSIGSDIANPLIMMDRDLLEIPGSLSSGVLPTFLFNNIINCLYIRMAFYSLYRHQFPDASKEECQFAFASNVRFFGLGDDNTYSVSPTALLYFNFATIQTFFQSIGLKYTNANKTDDVYGSLPLSEATIGKRKWAYNDEAKMMFCPIEKPSIMKMLSIGVASKAITIEQQELQSLESAIPELVQYGREEYDSRVRDLCEIFPSYKFPNFDSQVSKQRGVGITPWLIPEVSSGQGLSCDDLVYDHANQHPQLVTQEPSNKHAISMAADAFEGVTGEAFEASIALGRLEGDKPSNGPEYRMSSSVSSVKSRVTGMSYRLSTSYINSPAGGSDSGNTKGADDVHNAPNFGVSETDSGPSTAQTVTFKEEPGIYSVDISAPRDSTYNDGHSDNVSLGDFLSRPSKIYSSTWSVGYATSNYNVVFDPWTLWQNDARIKQKLANYAYASFDLKLRFVINGSPFQYGNLMIIYIPYGKTGDPSNVSGARNQTAAQIQNWYNSSGASGQEECAYQHFSTYPHAFLNPTSNKVVEMTLPFIWHNNFISLNGDTSVAKESLGTIQIYDVNPLRIANTSAPTAVNYTVYATAENVKVNTPTEFVPTSEFNDGPVSSPASSVMEAAGKLSRAPIIGPFARATEIGAGALGGVASIFGFSAPNRVQPPDQTSLKMHGRMACSSGEDASTSLAMDPKQEITVDPRTVGVSAEDEMTIKSLVTREQFLARCEWKSDVGQFTTVGAEQVIFASLVNPNQVHRTGSGKVGASTWQMVMDHPAGWLANMFQYWKGSITFRVEVCCTRMHAGRLKLQFDPFIKNGAHTVADVNTDDVNARYTVILDLQEETSTEFTINWNNRRAWLRTRADETVSTFEPYRTNQTAFALQAAYDPEVDMGIFVVSVVNELVAPIDTNGTASSTKAPVQVNIFAKMGDDMQFAQLSEDASGWSNNSYEPTSSVTDAPGSLDVTEHSTTGAYVDDHNTAVFFGESVISLRSLIKRYVMVFTGTYGTHSTNIEGVKRYMPMTNAYVTTGVARRNSYLSYLMPGFLIARGSTRYKLNYMVKNNNAEENMGSMYNYAQRVTFRTPTNSIGYPVVNLNGATSATMQAAMPHGYNGICFTSSEYNPVLEFQLPFYSNTRFMLGTHYRNVGNSGNEVLAMNPAMTQILAAENFYTGSAAANNLMQQWFSAGDDFSLSFFTGVPGTFFFVSTP